MHMHTKAAFQQFGSNLQLLMLTQAANSYSQKQKTNNVEKANEEL